MKRSGRKAALNFSGVTPAENDFLITRLDPFHDEPFLPTGGPGTAPTVVRCFKRSVTVSAPNPSSTNNWSFVVGSGQNGLPVLPSTANSSTCSMFLRNFANSLDNLASNDFTRTFEYGGNNSLTTYTTGSSAFAGPTCYPSAPCYVIARDAAAWQSSVSVTSSGGATPTFTYNPPDSVNKSISVCQFGENVYADGPSKLVSIAYEVHMTTSDLYNTGNVTVGRVPQALAMTAIRVAQQTGNPVSVPAVSTAVLPSNAGELLLYSGSKTWPAKYGVYAVAPASSSSVPDFDPNPFANHLSRTQSWQAARSNGNSTFAMGVCTSERDGKTYLASTEHFDTIMAMFEGLDPRATLIVTVSLIYETIPTDSTLLRPLARLPLEIRPHIMAAYEHSAAYVDCFCMVNENASGGFFRRVRGAFEAAKTALNSPLGKAARKALAAATGGTSENAIQVATDVVRGANHARNVRNRAKKKAKAKAKKEANPATAGKAANPRKQ